MSVGFPKGMEDKTIEVLYFFQNKMEALRQALLSSIWMKPRDALGSGLNTAFCLKEVLDQHSNMHRRKNGGVCSKGKQKRPSPSRREQRNFSSACLSKSMQTTLLPPEWFHKSLYKRKLSSPQPLPGTFPRLLKKF